MIEIIKYSTQNGFWVFMGSFLILALIANLVLEFILAVLKILKK